MCSSDLVDAETAAKYADFKLVFGKNNGTTTYTTSWAGPAAKDVTVNLIVNGEVAGVVYEYSGNSLPKDNCVAPVLSGKKFVGWYADEELTVEYDFSTELTVNQELNLYAKYEGVNYDVHTLIVPEKGQSWSADTQIDEAGVLFLTNKVKTESIKIEGASYPTDNLVFENTQISLTGGKVQIDGGNFLNAIKVVVERNAVITVYAAQKSDKTTNLKVLNLDGTDATIENLRIDGVPATEFNTLPTTSVSKYEFNVGPGIYGIGGAGGGAYVYGLNVAIEVEQEITNPVPSFSIIADDAEGVMVAQPGQVTTLGTPAIVTFTTTQDAKFWNYDPSGKTVVVDGVEFKTNGRIKQESKGNTLSIDLSSYTGSVTLTFYYAPAGDSERSLSIVSGGATAFEITHTDKNVHSATVTLECGKVYNFVSTNSFNFYSFEFDPVTE